jgi:eukaryotic-like serine/threonine-protein kinase
MQTLRCDICGARLAPSKHCGFHPNAAKSAVLCEATEGTFKPFVASYELGELLGEGASGVVYAARAEGDRGSKESPFDLAIKCTRPGDLEASSRLQQEIRYMKRAGAKVTLPLHAYGDLPNGCRWLVMPRLTVPTLATLMSRTAGPMPFEQCLLVADAVARTLVHLHAKGLVHRDLSPENIVVDLAASKPRAFLLDFGCVLEIGATVTKARRGEGTALYMAPERFDDERPTSASSDLYALSAILYEMLVGHPLFWGSVDIVKQGHMEHLVPLLSGSLSALNDLLRSLLNKRIERRPADARAWRKTLPKDPSPIAERSDETDSTNISTITAPTKPSLPVLFLGKVGCVSDPAVLDAIEGICPAGTGQVLVFGTQGHDADPLSNALAAAAHLLAKGLTTTVHIDVCEVQIRGQAKRTRVASSAFSELRRFPQDTAYSRGAWISSAVKNARPDLLCEQERDDFFKLSAGIDDADWTTIVQGDDLVGRQQIQARMTTALESGLSMRGPVALRILGEKGLGKSAMGHWFAQAARQRGASLIRLRPQSSQRGVEEHGSVTLAKALVTLGFDPSTATDPLAWALAAGQLSGDSHDVRVSAAAPGALRGRMIRVLAEALRRCAEKRALTVIVDDADKLDDVSLGAIDAVTAVVALPFVAVFLAAPALAVARPLLGSTAPICATETLIPLAPHESQELTTRLLHEVQNAPDKALAMIAARAAGNPQLLHELVKGLRMQGAVKKEGRRAWLDTQFIDKLPSTLNLHWLAKHELASIPGELLPIAQLLAIWGPEILPADLESLVETSLSLGVSLGTKLDPSSAVRHLYSHQIANQRRDGCIRFRSETLAQTIASEVPAHHSRSLHMAAAHHWLHAHAVPDHVRLPRLAIHAKACGQMDLAAQTAWTLATKAAQKHDDLQAEHWFSLLLTCLTETADSTMLCRAHLGLAFARLRMGQQENALADLNAAVTHSVTAPALLTAEIQLERAMVLDWLNDYPAAEAATSLATVACAASTELPKSLAAKLQLAQGRCTYRNGHFKDSAEQLNVAATAALLAGEEGYTTRMAANLLIAPALVQLGRAEQASRVFEDIIKESLSCGDDLHRSAALFNRAILRVGQADFAGALNDMTAVTALTRSAGLGFLLRDTELNCAEVAHLGRDAKAAHLHLEKYNDLLDRMPGVSLRERALGSLMLARLCFFDANTEAARASLTQLQDVTGQAAGLSETELLLASALQWALEVEARNDTKLLEQECDFNLPAERAEFRAIVAIGHTWKGRPDRAATTLAALLASQDPAVLPMRIAAEKNVIT